ncbi:nucleotidyltransferase domain-containing protein [Calderihabitans maritimus]|uniref:DNA polymerase beta domain-containing protein n=1 Tax=Calderihabitans maritimus TaxID=1246530 RepID=A0A1Z5HQB1_9FIRM|nr:nucleotidyltransferase domain-containing protein [Calderihabitans maritimus]GAW91704.1 DNA polymerase beta domain-containing protein [Calderihabitans maritimus]
MKQGSLEKRILQGLVDYLNDLYPGEIRLVQLFGPQARSDARQDSDYDVLIVVKDRSTINRSRIYDYVLDVNLKYGIDLSLKIYGEDEFELFKKKGVPFVREVLSEGYALWSQ